MTSGVAGLAAGFLCVSVAVGQTFELTTDYGNPWYSPVAAGEHVNLDRTSCAVYGGHSGPEPGPGNGVFFLEYSAFAHPVAGIRPDFKLGEFIVPPAGVDWGDPPDITPATCAKFLDYADPAVLATEPGPVEITWHLTNGTDEVRVYVISVAAPKDTVKLYWRDGSTFLGPMVNLNLPAVPYVRLHYNRTITDQDVILHDKQLMANPGVEGKVVLEYMGSQSSGPYLGMEVIDVVSPERFVEQIGYIGRRLLPLSNRYGDDGRTAHVARGEGDGTPASQFVYKHQSLDADTDGHVFAVRKTVGSYQIEIYWQRHALFDVLWPDELSRYMTRWPDDPQLYVRGTDGVHGPDVIVPSELSGEIMSYKEMSAGGIATYDAGTRTFHAEGTGYVLMKYEADGEVCFEAIRCVQHNNADVFKLTPLSWQIPLELEPRRVNRALGLDGTAGLRAPAREGFDTDSFTVEAWVRTDETNGNFVTVNDARGFVLGWGTDAGRGYTNQYFAGMYDPDWVQSVVVTGRTVQVDEWVHLAVIYDNARAELKLFVDGLSADTAAWTSAPVVVGAPLEFAPDWSGMEQPSLKGQLDELRVWSYARSEGEIFSSYNTRFIGSESGLVFYCTFDDARAGEFADLTGNGSAAVQRNPFGAEVVHSQALPVEPLNAESYLQAPGYLHWPEGDYYNPNTYSYPTNGSKIFPVNKGNLEVWWSARNLQPSMPDAPYWPSLVNRYDCTWPSDAPQIVLASGLGALEMPDDFSDPVLYVQNNSGEAGYNPNEEHAMILAGTPYALRNDLNQPDSSDPFVLIEYIKLVDGKVNMAGYEVVLTNAEHDFVYELEAGTLIQPPMPLTVLPNTEQTICSEGRAWRDRKLNWWAYAAGDDGSSATALVMSFEYPCQSSFWFPPDYALSHAAGDPVPWLSYVDGSPEEPIEVTYTVSWPSNCPVLFVGETLVKPKRGLPAIAGQKSVELLYQQSAPALGPGDFDTLHGGESVALMDPTRERVVDLSALPGDVETETTGNKVYFSTLPPHLRERLWYDSTRGSAGQLVYRGEFIEPAAGESYLLLNVLEGEDRTRLHDLSADGSWQAAIDSLAADVLLIGPEDLFDSRALSAGLAEGEGFVTLAFNSSTNFCAPADPISLNIIKVVKPVYNGEIKVIEPRNPLHEILTLRHSGDFCGEVENYEFEWRTLPPDGGGPSALPPDQWNIWGSVEAGKNAIVIEGPGLFTLSDNFFVCRLRNMNPLSPAYQEWSEWTDPQLAEGWIKRAMSGINPFEQRVDDYRNKTVNSTVSMISQAGARWVGDVPMNLDVIDDYGLIEIYETLYRRAAMLSIDAGFDYAPANDALLLAAGRLSDLYMLLGNEAYADAADPTIAFGTDDGTYGSAASSLFCFMNQVPSVLHEELALLRGRDNSALPSVETYPVYNRLIWNFTHDMTGGEVAYALNYNIKDQDGEVGGSIDENDAAALYPQGHGDAWGHYLMAVKLYYRLLNNTHFTWTPRAESVLVGGVPVSVDYMDERKFTKAASAKARAGLEVASLEYRRQYTENPIDLVFNYEDSNTDRAWGTIEWGSRVGQGAYFDWVMGNAVLPEEDIVNEGIQKIDRTTVPELAEIATYGLRVQEVMDNADSGVNPLGLASQVMPFDISPTEIDAGNTHFEQIYARAIRALNNAVTLFNNAADNTQRLRQQADSLEIFSDAVTDQEADYENRLIEMFGYPYSDDIGPGKTYPSGYDGPDVYHHNLVDIVDLVGETPDVQSIELPTYRYVKGEGWTDEQIDVEQWVDANTQWRVKPPSWTGSRRAPGDLQLALGELVRAVHELQRMNTELRLAVKKYENVWGYAYDVSEYLDDIDDIERKVTISKAVFRTTLAGFEAANRYANHRAQRTIQYAGMVADMNPRCIGTATDPSSLLRSVTYSSAIGTVEALDKIGTFTKIGAEVSRASIAIAEGIGASQEEDIRDDILEDRWFMEAKNAKYEAQAKAAAIQVQLDAIQQLCGQYSKKLAEGARLLDEREAFRRRTAANIQEYRYKDMAFRIFRNDELQKYRAAFDLAARYVYLAAKAYDYETTLLSGDSTAEAGSEFLSSIVKARALGTIVNGIPQVGGAGDHGLADVMARMDANWQVLEGRLGFNNPDTETGRFSLRCELFRISGLESSDALWRETLWRHCVDNLLEYPEFKQYCIEFDPQLAVEPAIIIPFATEIQFGKNFFGHPLAGGDNAYDSTHFSTKIRSVGVWFSNYNSSGEGSPGGLANQPRVYLIPVGYDVLRSPTELRGTTCHWRIFDQALPLPYPIGEAQIADSAFIPMHSMSDDESIGQLRRYPSMRAYHDSGAFDPAETISNSRLIGRSVWNTRWLLIIPAGTLHSDREEALFRFIDGSLLADGERDGNGVNDIKIFFQTYSYAGN